MGARIPLTTPVAQASQRSRSRIAIDQFMATNADTSYSARQVALATGVPLAKAREHLGNALVCGQIHRSDGGSHAGALYRHGPPPVALLAPGGPTPRYTPPRGSYDGKELQPYTGRPGAMRAFELPSLVNGQRIQRRGPAPIGSHVKDPQR